MPTIIKNAPATGAWHLNRNQIDRLERDFAEAARAVLVPAVMAADSDRPDCSGISASTIDIDQAKAETLIDDVRAALSATGAVETGRSGNSWRERWFAVPAIDADGTAGAMTIRLLARTNDDGVLQLGFTIRSMPFGDHMPFAATVADDVITIKAVNN